MLAQVRGTTVSFSIRIFFSSRRDHGARSATYKNERLANL